MSSSSSHSIETSSLENAWEKFKENVRVSKSIENLLTNRAGSMPTKEFSRRAQETTLACRKTHEAHERSLPAEDLSDERLLSFCRYTDGLPLKDYEQALALVPSLVNLVSLAEAVPIDGSSLPFDLKAIAVKCRSAVYFAPRRFTAIQLAFDSPRSRVLLFRKLYQPIPNPNPTSRCIETPCTDNSLHFAFDPCLQTLAEWWGRVSTLPLRRRCWRIPADACSHGNRHRLRQPLRRQARRHPRRQDHRQRGRGAHRNSQVRGN